MEIELLVVPGCANQNAAEAVLAEAVRLVGLATTARTVVVTSQDRADALGFVGSPSFYANGRDLFPQEDVQPALACRVYPTPDGLRGTPPVDDLAAALRSIP